jgi:hypothetical protein
MVVWWFWRSWIFWFLPKIKKRNYCNVRRGLIWPWTRAIVDGVPQLSFLWSLGDRCRFWQGFTDIVISRSGHGWRLIGLGYSWDNSKVYFNFWIWMWKWVWIWTSSAWLILLSVKIILNPFPFTLISLSRQLFALNHEKNRVIKYWKTFKRTLSKMFFGTFFVKPHLAVLCFHQLKFVQV